MTYQSGTIASSAYAARDLMAALQPAITAGGLSLVETYNPPAGNWPSVAYGNGTFVAVSNSTGTAATSPDGITWTARTLPVTVSWQAVCYGNGLFVAVASSTNACATSPDGITWTLRSMPVSQNWTAVCYGGGQFVAVGTGTQICATSPDGITWTPRTMGFTGAYVAVVYGGTANLYVALIQSTSTVMTSPDGITWTQRTGPNSTAWTSMAATPTMIAAVSQGGNVAQSSPDGINWTQRTLPASGNWQSVCYGNGLWVATCSSTSTQAATSTDGMTWNSTVRVLPVAASWTGVCYGGGTYAAVTSNGTGVAASSPDGINWTQRALTGTNTSTTVDVYKSPAAGNQFGSDWYLLLRRTTDATTQVFYQVAEQYTVATHKAANYGGTGVSTVPAATTYANPLVANTVDQATVYGTNAVITGVSLAPFLWFCSATVNRVVIGLRQGGGTENGCYLGLYDDLLPAGVTQFPLVAARVPLTSAAAQAIGNGGTNQTGGFTREPLQTVALAANFEASIHNSYVVGVAAAVGGWGFTPLTSASALYGNTFSVSRVPIGSNRTASTPGDAVRGLLIGCVICASVSIAGDTITANGKTYVRMCGPTTTYAICADQSL